MAAITQLANISTKY